MLDVAAALVRGEAFEERADGIPEGIDGAGGRFSEQGFQLGKDLLDGVVVGAVRRQVAQLGTGGRDGLLNAGNLMGTQVVHDHDVAGSKFRHQHLLDPGTKDLAVDRSVEHQGGRHAFAAQRAQEGRGAPVARRHFPETANAFRGPSPGRGHGGRGPGLIDKHQASGHHVGLGRRPSLPRLRYVRPFLLRRME